MKEDLDSKVGCCYNLPKSEEEVELDNKHQRLKDRAKGLNIIEHFIDIYCRSVREYKSTIELKRKTSEVDFKKYIIGKCSEFLESCEELEIGFRVLRNTAERLGVLDQLYNIENKAFSDYMFKNKYNGNTGYLESKRYAFKECDKFIEGCSNRKMIDKFIMDERKFRRNQSKLPLNLPRSFRLQHLI